MATKTKAKRSTRSPASKPRAVAPLPAMARLRLAFRADRVGWAATAAEWEISFRTLKAAIAGDGLTTPIRGYLVCKLFHADCAPVPDVEVSDYPEPPEVERPRRRAKPKT